MARNMNAIRTSRVTSRVAEFSNTNSTARGETRREAETHMHHHMRMCMKVRGESRDKQRSKRPQIYPCEYPKLRASACSSAASRGPPQWSAMSRYVSVKLSWLCRFARRGLLWPCDRAAASKLRTAPGADSELGGASERLRNVTPVLPSVSSQVRVKPAALATVHGLESSTRYLRVGSWYGMVCAML